MRRSTCFSHLSIPLSAVIALTLVAPPAVHAEIKGLTVLAAKDIGPFRGKGYREVEARMEGTAPGGAYAVPVTLAFPKEASDHNGFAIVDVINTVTIGKEQFVIGGGAFPVARRHMGDDFLFGTGNAYVGVIWDKNAVEALDNGTIATPADGYTILRDVAALARDPAAMLPAGAGAPPASAKVVAYGYSQTGSLLRAWYFDHLNTQGGAPTFDGALVAGAGGFCKKLDPPGDAVCEGPLADGGKVIVLSTETDAEWAGYLERGETADYRVVEIAGVSHIPAANADFRAHGLPDQNPVGFGPAFRAALVNLQAWLNGTEPPPSITIDLTDEAPKDLQGGPYRPAARDDDGNAEGGLRLPHMPIVLGDGTKAGAPLGRYDGLAWAHETSNIFFLISGTFTPFPPDKLEALYPDHKAYVAAVAAAAEDLVAKRYILPEDGAAYVEAAAQSDIGRR
jgi:hypothetical protein